MRRGGEPDDQVVRSGDDRMGVLARGLVRKVAADMVAGRQQCRLEAGGELGQ